MGHDTSNTWSGFCPQIGLTCAIIAGSARGAKFAEAHLSPFLDAAQKRARAAGLWSYVDDAAGRVEGAEATVEQQPVDLADEFLQQAHKRILKISPETTLIASSTNLRRRIWRRLRARGLPGRQQSTMVDLGADVSGAGKRARRTAR